MGFFAQIIFIVIFNNFEHIFVIIDNWIDTISLIPRTKNGVLRFILNLTLNSRPIEYYFFKVRPIQNFPNHLIFDFFRRNFVQHV